MSKYLLPLALGILLTACGESDNPPQDAADSGSSMPASAPAAMPATTADDAEGGIENRGSAADEGKWWSALPRPEWNDFEKIETRNPWFEVYKIMEGIYAIYEPGQFEEVISYLIIGRNQALLFDTGLGMGDMRSVVKQLTDKPLVVLNSHSHYDHVGGNHQFDIILGRKHPYTQKRSKGLSNEEVGEYALGDWIWKTRPPNFQAKEYAIQPWEFSRWIEEGQFIDLGGVSLEIIYSPGHAPDSLVLVDHQRRLMFTGDTFYLAPLYTHTSGASFPDYVDSAARLAAMADDIDYLLMSHNTPLADGRYLKTLDAAFQAILSGNTPYKLTDGVREYNFEGFKILTEDPPEEPAPVIEAL